MHWEYDAAWMGAGRPTGSEIRRDTLREAQRLMGREIHDQGNRPAWVALGGNYTERGNLLDRVQGCSSLPRVAVA